MESRTNALGQPIGPQEVKSAPAQEGVIGKGEVDLSYFACPQFCPTAAGEFNFPPILGDDNLREDVDSDPAGRWSFRQDEKLQTSPGFWRDAPSLTAS